MRDLQNRGASGAEGRTKETCLYPSDISDRLRAIRELSLDLRARKQNQMRMTLGVVRDQVSGSNNCTRNLRTRGNKFSDQKKSGLHFMLGQHLEQALGMHVVGTIIVSQRKMFWIGTVRKSAPIELRSRRIAVVREPTGSG